MRNPGSSPAIGIDIGATKVALGVVSPSGELLSVARMPTAAEQGFNDGIRRMVAGIDEVVRQAGLARGDLAGIGIGCTGPVNPKTGVIETDFTLPSWGGKNLIAAMQDATGLSVCLENDADAALVGEAAAGAGVGAEAIVMLTFGTGIGGAAMSSGAIYRGASGEHPEIGHVPIDPSGPACYCGLPGCLESIASGTAIGQAGKNADFADATAVFAAARAGDPKAKAIVAGAIQATQLALWTLVHTFLPERFILGGGIMDAHWDLFEPPLRAYLARANLGPTKGMSIARAKLGNDAGLIGAGFLGMGR